MTADEIGRFVYIGLIAFAVSGWLMADARKQLGVTMRNLLVWSFIFVGVIGAVGLWEDLKSDVVPRQLVLEGGSRIELPLSRDGHYYMTLEANGSPVRFVVDTGATDIVLTRQDAEMLGIDVDDLAFSSIARTANGVVQTAPTVLKTLAAGGVIDRNVRVVVNGGEMDASLLGMRYLRSFSRIEISNRTMVLER